MKFLFSFALLICGLLEIHASQLREWGRLHPRDEVMFNVTFREKAYSGNNHLLTIRTPEKGEIELQTVTYVSLENRIKANAELKVVDGGIGKNFVTLFFRYPEDAEVDVTLFVRGIFNGPCKSRHHQ